MSGSVTTGRPAQIPGLRPSSVPKAPKSAPSRMVANATGSHRPAVGLSPDYRRICIDQSEKASQKFHYLPRKSLLHLMVELTFCASHRPTRARLRHIALIQMTFPQRPTQAARPGWPVGLASRKKDAMVNKSATQARRQGARRWIVPCFGEIRRWIRDCAGRQANRPGIVALCSGNRAPGTPRSNPACPGFSRFWPGYRPPS